MCRLSEDGEGRTGTGVDLPWLPAAGSCSSPATGRQYYKYGRGSFFSPAIEQPMTNDDFNITGHVIERQELILETSLDDPDLDESLASDTPLTFEEVAGGTKRGGRMLLSSDGY
ncbi:hypothetical protein Pcinc_009004 [Petrolisthes cinctipes]|uniref:Uncharacterized protein n=1 Tax=Petrolisthes cinctipes TaxID=88211 RepID=A0AAE1G897_PETCI|nr:hypothetical protein Pcinc_009004 [Petrolisthes cinctipes]